LVLFPQPDVADLSRIIERAQASLKASCVARGLMIGEFHPGPPTRFAPEVEVAAYYVVSEALTNAQKHARASSVRVRAGATADALQIEIADDGIGGAADPANGGLAGLRDRVEALGGTFEMVSPCGEGTRVSAAIPRR